MKCSLLLFSCSIICTFYFSFFSSFVSTSETVTVASVKFTSGFLFKMWLSQCKLHLVIGPLISGFGFNLIILKNLAMGSMNCSHIFIRTTGCGAHIAQNCFSYLVRLLPCTWIILLLKLNYVIKMAQDLFPE